MADQHNDNIPALANQIVNDVPDIKENLEYHKDVFQNFCTTWSNTVATGIYPNKFADTTGTPIILQKKVVEIGDWDMDAGTTVAVAHGLTLGNIRNISVVVRNDADSAYYIDSLGTATLKVGISSVGAANVNLFHDGTGGAGFDSTSFDSTSYNRGWILIEYVAS